MTAGRLRGAGLLALWGDADPEHDAGFNDWYTHEHLPERIAVPGFLRARRYVADLPSPGRPRWRYLTLYETDTVDTLSSPAYLRALDEPTEGTRRYLPLFAAMARTGARVTHSAGTGEGGDVAFVELGPGDDPDGLRRWITEQHAPVVLARSGVLATRLAEADQHATAVRDRTEAYRGVPTTAGRWLLLVEAATVDLPQARRLLAADIAALKAHGAAIGGAEIFRLLARLKPQR